MHQQYASYFLLSTNLFISMKLKWKKVVYQKDYDNKRQWINYYIYTQWVNEMSNEYVLICISILSTHLLTSTKLKSTPVSLERKSLVAFTGAIHGLAGTVVPEKLYFVPSSP